MVVDGRNRRATPHWLTWLPMGGMSQWRSPPAEDGPDAGLVAAVEPVDSEEEEAEEEDIDNRNNIIMQYFQ
ncbi:hypothetical protein NDU88_002430 [Pleurodeles waltl]|uniref:Uncharacterized protein n=1 Tax=Pleurodeles waltl TaxID=8319 RepID=A0AAV7LFK0_PLEWA|nr:hypothetical protein NDU88_002430 [Pleurodeles waltl]